MGIISESLLGREGGCVTLFYCHKSLVLLKQELGQIVFYRSRMIHWQTQMAAVYCAFHESGFFLPAKIREIWSPLLNASLNRTRVCIAWKPGNHERIATGAITMRPIHISYKRATATTTPHAHVYLSKRGLSTRQIWRMPQPVGTNANKLVSKSRSLNGVSISSTVITVTTTIRTIAWIARYKRWRLAA